MFSNDYEADQEIIDTHYVLTLMNDGVLYNTLRPLVARGRFNSFCDVLRKFIRPICNERNESSLANNLGSETTRFVPMAFSRTFIGVWDQMRSNANLMTHIEDTQEMRKNILPGAIKYYTLAPATPTSLNSESEIMTTSSITVQSATPIQNLTVVYGKNAADMTDEELIAAIKRLENDIVTLNQVKAESKKIAAKRAEAEAAIAALVVVLDARA